MKANELMIGDWVYMEAHKGYEAQYIKVETIPDASSKDHYGHIGAFPVGGDNDFRDIEDRHLFPIPLTPEILEKNGFKPEKSEFREVKHWIIAEDYYDTIVYEWSDGIWLFMNESTEMNIPATQATISYVHELQNALRLCGIEKEITI